MATTTRHPNYNRLAPNPTGSNSAKLFRLFSDPTFGTLGDILEVCPLARGMVIGPGCVVQTDEIDDGTDTVVISLEIVDDSDVVVATVIDGSDVGQAGGLAQPTKAPATEDGVGYVVPADNYKLRLIVDTAANSEAAAKDILVVVDIGGARDNQLTE